MANPNWYKGMDSPNPDGRAGKDRDAQIFADGLTEIIGDGDLTDSTDKYIYDRYLSEREFLIQYIWNKTKSSRCLLVRQEILDRRMELWNMGNPRETRKMYDDFNHRLSAPIIKIL